MYYHDFVFIMHFLIALDNSWTEKNVFLKILKNLSLPQCMISPKSFHIQRQIEIIFQRPSPKMLIHLVHVAALANFAYALYFDIYLVKLPKSQPRHDVCYKSLFWLTSSYHLIRRQSYKRNFVHKRLNLISLKLLDSTLLFRWKLIKSCNTPLMNLRLI